ncbi:MAG TPA: complex I NDUFA9 subunit family protein [Caulobacteraceae bacterium]|jgi:NADH dehydrogenase|nr:complex I NDUFA9 subunit family protein [Caulobacteraceae bacterium]
MQGLVTVFGGSGFIGAQAVRALAKRGFRIRAAMRRPGRGYRLRMLGDVGQIEVAQANVRDPASVARALDGAQACVNLVGVLSEQGRQRFQSVHAMGAQVVAEAAVKAGVGRFVQVSAIGAAHYALSKYARSKAEGESAVRKLLPEAVILRPSIVFGPQDDFFNRFARMAVASPALPLIGGGKTLFQPVFVGDVAAAIAQCISDPATEGRTFELGGPGVYSFEALMRMILAAIERKTMLLPIPFPVASLIGMAGDLQAMVMKPVLTTDQVASLRADSVVSPAAAGLAALRVTPTALEAVLPTYLGRYRKNGQYADLVEQVPQVLSA